MKYGILSPNRSINAAIYSCLSCVRQSDAEVVVRKLKSQAEDHIQVMHTFRELLVGAYLADSGRRVAYEASHAGARPDWTLCDETGDVSAIVEITNFHTPRTVESEIVATLERGAIYCDWSPDPTERLYQSIQKKIDRYHSLVMSLSCPYIVAVYTDFRAAIEPEEVYDVLHTAYGGGIFSYSESISGVLWFEEDG